MENVDDSRTGEIQNPDTQYNFIYLLGGVCALAGITATLFQYSTQLGSLVYLFSSILIAGSSSVSAIYCHKRNLKLAENVLVAITVASIPLALYGLLGQIPAFRDSDRLMFATLLVSTALSSAVIYLKFKYEYVWWISIGAVSIFIFNLEYILNIPGIGSVSESSACLFLGISLLLKYKKPFIVAPTALALFSSIMQMCKLFTVIDFCTFLVIGGLAFIALGIAILIKYQDYQEHAGWLMLAGALLVFWAIFDANPVEAIWASIFLAASLFVWLGIEIEYRPYTIIGIVGWYAYLFHLISIWVSSDALVPLYLSFSGVALVLTGVVCQKHSKAITEKVQGSTPLAIKGLMWRFRKHLVGDTGDSWQ